MRRKAMKALALAMALLMLAGLAFSEELLGGYDDELQLGAPEDAEIIDIDSGAMDDTVIALDGLDLSLDTDIVAPVETAIYRFIVDDAEYAVQEAREGEAIVRPEDPAAPDGKAFVGWVLSDGTRLFADDGEDAPVIVRKAELGTEVYVRAEFADTAEEQPAEEESAEEQPEAEESAEEEPVEEQPAEEEPAEEEPAEEQPEAEESAEEEPAEEKSTEEQPAEEQPAEEQPVEEETVEKLTVEEPAEEQPAEEEPVGERPAANALTYNGEAQALLNAHGAWLYSLDGETYSEKIPTAVDAGEYTVYYKAAEDAEPGTLTVTVAKADVTFTPPVSVTIED